MCCVERLGYLDVEKSQLVTSGPAVSTSITNGVRVLGPCGPRAVGAPTRRITICSLAMIRLLPGEQCAELRSAWLSGWDGTRGESFSDHFCRTTGAPCPYSRNNRRNSGFGHLADQRGVVVQWLPNGDAGQGWRGPGTS